MSRADIDPAQAVQMVRRRRESQKRIAATARARDRNAGLRLVQVKVPEEGVTILRKFAAWLRGEHFDELEAALKIREEYVSKLPPLDHNYLA
jgi:hypothetical protein